MEPFKKLHATKHYGAEHPKGLQPHLLRSANHPGGSCGNSLHTPHCKHRTRAVAPKPSTHCQGLWHSVAKRTFAIIAFLYISIPGIYSQETLYTTEDSVFIETVLKGIHNTGDPEKLLTDIANRFIGKPYGANTLEISDDFSTVINTRELDCTTFIENVIAIARCISNSETGISDFASQIASLRYRNGVGNGYTSRLHYFSDWIIDNERRGNITEISAPQDIFNGIQKPEINYMSTHFHNYAFLRNNPDSIRKIRETEARLSRHEFRYIPKKTLAAGRSLKGIIRNGDIVAITTDKPGLDITHLGMAIWDADGLHLIHASSRHKKIIHDKLTLRQYLLSGKSRTGIRILRPRLN